MRKVQYGRQDKICGTAHLIESGGKRIVVDWGGGFEGAGKTRVDIIPEGNFLLGTHVDYLILTHAHLDHALYVPRFLRLHPETVGWMTRETFAILKILFADSLVIAKNNRGEAKRRGEYPLPVPAVTEDEFASFIRGDQIEFVKSGEWLNPWNGWSVGFYSAGHLTGAVSVFIDPACDRPVYLTGDISSQDLGTVPGVMTPPEDFLQGFFDEKGLLMVSEATNGGRDALRSREEEYARLEFQINEVRARGGVSLIATFATGRTSDIAKALLRVGIVPYVDGMARNLIGIEAPEVLSGNRVRLVPSAFGEEARLIRQRIAETPGNVIIASSGSLEGGTAVSYAEHILPGRENAVFFVGHIFNETVAEKLLKIERGHTIRLPDFQNEEGIIVNVRSDVYRFDYLSAHDYKGALAERVRRVNPETLIVHHIGESNGVDGFVGLSEKIRQEMGDGAPEMIRESHLCSIEKGGDP